MVSFLSFFIQFIYFISIFPVFIHFLFLFNFIFVDQFQSMSILLTLLFVFHYSNQTTGYSRVKPFPKDFIFSQLIFFLFFVLNKKVEKQIWWSKWAQMVQNYEKWSKIVKIVKMFKIFKNGKKWWEMAQNGPKWPKMVRNGQKVSEMAKHCLK